MTATATITTIQEAKQYLKSNYEKGVSCPCCGQFVKLYKRKINSGMSLGLLYLYKINGGGDFIHVPTAFTQRKINHANLELAKLLYWELVEERLSTEDDKKNSGYWKLTNKGIDYVLNRIKVPKHVFIYNNKVKGFSNNSTGITESLGDKFNYHELMNAS